MLRFIFVILKNVKRAPYLIPQMRKMIKNKDKYTEEERYRLVKKLINYLKRSGSITTEVYGKENLPKEGGYVMFPNHQGKYDVLGIVYGHDKPCSFVMDKAKSYSFFVREIVDLLGAKRLDLTDIRQNLKIINEITDEVAQGKKFILFSEGGYDHNKNVVKDFKPGSFKSVIRAKAPLVPVALIDSYKPFNSFSIKPVTTKVIFLPAIYYEDYKDMKTVELSNMVRQQIIDTIDEYGGATS
ncbi:MAG: 1-acyl-sn-glycerol-3-phosphate acyltransferase [Lachnospiraceae bacterium]|nr:1-acyl-sn-glycerol-3-phosphate acyltransferase [Lachnospiraceae bacterium]